MSCGRLVLCAVLLGPTALAAQDARDTVGPLEAKANAITAENPVPRRTTSVAAIYPEEARAVNATAIVTFIATLDAAGRVGEIRKAGTGFEGLNNPLVMAPPGTTADAKVLRNAGEAFVKSAAAALRQWRYEAPANAPISFPVTFNFTTTGEPTASQDVSGRRLPNAPAASLPGFVSSVAPLGAASTLNPVRVGGNIKAPTQTKRVPPVYPAEALAARVQGVVILEAVIGPDGKVANAQVLRSVPLLDQAALDSVRQWEYTPTLMNGAPVPVIMTVTVTFTLDGGTPPPPPGNQ